MSTWEVHRTDPKHEPCWYCRLSVKMAATVPPRPQSKRATQRNFMRSMNRFTGPGPRPPEKEVFFMGFKIRKKVARSFLYDIIKMQQFTINRVLEEQATQKAPESVLVQPVTDPRIIERIADGKQI